MKLVDYVESETTASSVPVAGNEACDLDSFVSALVTAYALTKRGSGEEYVPVAQTTLEDIKSIKLEIPELFKIWNIDESMESLIYQKFRYEPIRWESFSSLVLTDHNNVHSSFKGRVELIIDHHQELEPITEADRKVIDQSCSCCSLVADEFYDGLDDLCKKFLLSVILLDTHNLTQKVTQRDQSMAEKLMNDLTLEGKECTEIFNRLHGVRHNPDFWRSLTVPQQLRADLKIFDQLFACSTIRLDFDPLRNAEDLKLALAELCETRGVKIAFALYHGKRKTVVGYSNDIQVIANMRLILNKESYLSELAINTDCMIGWSVNDITLTRKQIAPLLSRCLKEIKS
jgi:inorganic pyrophosphatase/exopolyphosphatase